MQKENQTYKIAPTDRLTNASVTWRIPSFEPINGCISVFGFSSTPYQR